MRRRSRRLRAQAQAKQNELESAVQADPRVQDVMAKWPGAKIETVRRTRRRKLMPTCPNPPADDEDYIIRVRTVDG